MKFAHINIVAKNFNYTTNCSFNCSDLNGAKVERGYGGGIGGDGGRVVVIKPPQ